MRIAFSRDFEKRFKKHTKHFDLNYIKPSALERDFPGCIGGYHEDLDALLEIAK